MYEESNVISNLVMRKTHNKGRFPYNLHSRKHSDINLNSRIIITRIALEYSVNVDLLRFLSPRYKFRGNAGINEDSSDSYYVNLRMQVSRCR